MKHTPNHTHVLSSFGIALVLLTLGVGGAGAAPFQWSGLGTDNQWQNGANWTNTTAPSAGDSLIFTGTLRLNDTNSFTAGTSFGGITFNSPAAGFNLGGNSIALN